MFRHTTTLCLVTCRSTKTTEVLQGHGHEKRYKRGDHAVMLRARKAGLGGAFRNTAEGGRGGRCIRGGHDPASRRYLHDGYRRRRGLPGGRRGPGTEGYA